MRTHAFTGNYLDPRHCCICDRADDTVLPSARKGRDPLWCCFEDDGSGGERVLIDRAHPEIPEDAWIMPWVACRSCRVALGLPSVSFAAWHAHGNPKTDRERES